MTLRIVVVEDEPLACETLSEFIEKVPWLTPVGEANNGRTAIELIDKVQPDLVFLDVRLPGLSGLEVLKRIRHEPAIVFTPAYDHYAVSAFEFEAIDYLLKPFGYDRFVKTLSRVRRRLTSADSMPPVRERVERALGEQVLRRLFLEKNNHLVPVAADSIVRIEAQGDYVQVHTGGDTYLVHLTLNKFETRLDPERFRRVHRSHVVNLDHVSSIRPFDSRRLHITLRDGAEVVTSRAGAQRIQDELLK